MIWFLIALAGAGGTLLRYALSLAVPRLFGLPIPTLVVNILGSFAAGLVYHLAYHKFSIDEQTRQIIAVGLLGGLTTFSAFSLETVELWSSGRMGAAVLYATTSLVLSLASVGLGMKWV